VIFLAAAPALISERGMACMSSNALAPRVLRAVCRSCRPMAANDETFATDPARKC